MFVEARTKGDIVLSPLESTVVTDEYERVIQSSKALMITYKKKCVCHVGPTESERPRFKFLRSPEEAAAAIRGVLSADPRSVYRRTRCRDKLFFFTLDTADITCWFAQGFAEVLRVRPVERLIALM